MPYRTSNHIPYEEPLPNPYRAQGFIPYNKTSFDWWSFILFALLPPAGLLPLFFLPVFLLNHLWIASLVLSSAYILLLYGFSKECRYTEHITLSNK